MSPSAVRELDAALAATQGALDSDPLWYKDAVVHALHIKAYADGNGDGIGDLLGLTAHLDHVQPLGVNTIWPLPFYPSPQRDDGYGCAHPVQSPWQLALLRPPGGYRYAADDEFYGFTRTALAQWSHREMAQALGM